MEQQEKLKKCIFCGNGELIDSNVSFPEKRQASPVSMRKDGSPSYSESEYVDFSVKRCSECGFIHLFHFPDVFSKTTIK